ncbi:MAG: D-alanyl-D-alanine carboxypeptidase family protein [Candidatus Gracilibacteria bacterium]|jgi:D-alanyl-D-alanine carboxypeptidase|nr:D-alanyl-D-alanine carboxypeptidase family protein [Candidatus Gracilibacteria bacterium]
MNQNRELLVSVGIFLSFTLLFTAIGKGHNEAQKEEVKIENSLDYSDVDPFFDQNGEFVDGAIAVRNSILAKVKKDFKNDFETGEIVFLSHDKLAEILAHEEMAMVEQVFELDPEQFGVHFLRFSDCEVDYPRDKFQALDMPKQLGSRKIVTPFVHQKILPYLNEMLSRLEQEKGVRLYVESAYRSPYYQAFLFLDYTRHFKTVSATAEYVAIPCYSEHGTLIRPAVDFILPNGISDQNPELFMDSFQFDWIYENSREFGFDLTFTRDNRFGYGFEPWHFHFKDLPLRVGDLTTPLLMKRVSAVDDWGRFLENLPLKKAGTRTKMRFRRENRADGSEFIKAYNTVYEGFFRTMSVVDMPVSAQQDCSKHMVRLIAMFFESQGKKEKVQFPLIDGRVMSYEGGDFEAWLNGVMPQVGTQTWRSVLKKVENELDVRVGDLLIEPFTTHAVDEIYGDALVGHTALVMGIADDPLTNDRYYLIGSGSLPVTDFRISRAENRWQGQSGWLSLDGYLHRARRDNVEFYRIEDFAMFEKGE